MIAPSEVTGSITGFYLLNMQGPDGLEDCSPLPICGDFLGESCDLVSILPFLLARFRHMLSKQQTLLLKQKFACKANGHSIVSRKFALMKVNL